MPLILFLYKNSYGPFFIKFYIAFLITYLCIFYRALSLLSQNNIHDTHMPAASNTLLAEKMYDRKSFYILYTWISRLRIRSFYKEVVSVQCLSVFFTLQAVA